MGLLNGIKRSSGINDQSLFIEFKLDEQIGNQSFQKLCRLVVIPKHTSTREMLILPLALRTRGIIYYFHHSFAFYNAIASTLIACKSTHFLCTKIHFKVREQINQICRLLGISKILYNVFLELIERSQSMIKIRMVLLDQLFCDIFFFNINFGHPNRLKNHIIGCI